MSLILSFGPIARPDLLTSCSTVMIFFLLLIYIQPMLAARPKIVIFHQAKQNFYGFFQKTYFRPRYHFYSWQEASASMVLTVPWSSSLTSSTFCICPHVLSVRIEGRQQASLSPPFGITSLWLRRLQQPYICHRILSLSVNIPVYAI